MTAKTMCAGFFIMGLIMMASGVIRADEQAGAPSDPMQRRSAVLNASQQGPAAIKELAAALNDPDAMVRRAAVRSLGLLGQPAVAALTIAMNDSDMLVRRTALRALAKIQGGQSVATLAKALHDSNPIVRITAVEELSFLRPRTEAVTGLLQQAQKDADPAVGRLAGTLLHAFYKKVESVRQNPQFRDRLLNVVEKIPLPEEGWYFRIDPDQIGQTSEWYRTDFVDKDWQQIRIGEAWESQGHAGYDGVAWYRRTFKLPAKMEQAGTDIVFEGVDESAWVWINGQFVGCHDLGTMGWDQPFAADVTQVLKWGGENQITVRVQDRGFAGGIWKPVHLEVLK